MNEKKYDQSLRISTVGIREGDNQTGQYNRYEATPYKALEKLFQVYQPKKSDRIVDFGCGRGRTMFYIHNRFKVPVTGVEANDKTFEEALSNKASYRYAAKHIKAPIKFDYCLAEQYEVDAADNVFYFFNPFSIKIFKKVIRNILLSVKGQERPVEIILYYPLPEFKSFLKKSTPFTLKNKVKVPGIHGKYGKFKIYQLSKEMSGHTLV